MKTLADVDKNFKVETSIEEKNLKFLNVKNAPFKIYGAYSYEKSGKFLRLPDEIGKNVNEGVAVLYSNTAGIRVRFATSSPYVAISVDCDYCEMQHFAATGIRGFDMYEFKEGKYKYLRTFVPPAKDSGKYEGIFYFDDPENVHDITINFPLYNNVNNLYIGVEDGSELSEGGGYVNEKPIVYYGSSITQGGCASRPGMSYQSIISRKYNCDYINLGFSGSAKGEDIISDYIAELDMCCFVYDYDHNAPDCEHLRKTHERMFKKIRDKHPTMPIIIVTSPTVCWKDWEERREIIYTTYQNAVAAGDKNVYFINGMDMFGELGKECTVDGCHPTDFGFYYMSEHISDALVKSGVLYFDKI